MACEQQYKTYTESRLDADLKIYQNCLSRSDRTATADREHAASEAAADRKAAQYSQIHATSAALAQSRLPTKAPNYMQYLQSGAQYMAPRGPGFISKTTSGIGQGILIAAILGGGMLMMMLMFYMVKPKTVQQIPGFKKKKAKKKSRK
jgi:hypothetical protein